MLWQMGIYNNFVANGYVMWFKQMWYLVIVWLCEKMQKTNYAKKMQILKIVWKCMWLWCDKIKDNFDSWLQNENHI